MPERSPGTETTPAVPCPRLLLALLVTLPSSQSAPWPTGLPTTLRPGGKAAISTALSTMPAAWPGNGSRSPFPSPPRDRPSVCRRGRTLSAELALCGPGPARHRSNRRHSRESCTLKYCAL